MASPSASSCYRDSMKSKRDMHQLDQRSVPLGSKTLLGSLIRADGVICWSPLQCGDRFFLGDNYEKTAARVKSGARA
jgi:hypothetical protein